MRVTQVTFGATVNPRPYETERLDVTIEVEEGESPAEALRRGKEFVRRALGRLPSDTDNDDG